MNHVCHGLHQETAGTARGVKDAVILVHFENLVHKVRNVLGRENLAGLGLLLVSVELVEEDAHHVLTAPLVGVDALGNLDDPVYEVINCLLVVRRVHLDVGILFQQNVYLRVLLTTTRKRLGQGGVNRCVERGVTQILEALQTRAVTLGNQRARRKNHAVVQIFDAKLKMQTVVDSCRQLIDFLFIYRIDGIQR